MALADLNRANDTPIATLKLAEITPKNWRKFPPRASSTDPINVPSVSYSWPYNGISGDDVNVATANATGPYEPKNQGNKANMLGAQNRLAVDITTPRGWIDPAEPYGPPATPTLASINPTSRVVAPTTDIVMTLTGTNFMPSSQITIGGNPERTTYVSPTQLTTIIRGSVFTGVDPAIPVQVFNADKGSGTVNFAITAT
jgi:hypothetical protein